MKGPGLLVQIAMLLTGNMTRGLFNGYKIVNERERLTAAERLAAYFAETGSQSSPVDVILGS